MKPGKLLNSRQLLFAVPLCIAGCMLIVSITLGNLRMAQIDALEDKLELELPVMERIYDHLSGLRKSETAFYQLMEKGLNLQRQEFSVRGSSLLDQHDLLVRRLQSDLQLLLSNFKQKRQNQVIPLRMELYGELDKIQAAYTRVMQIGEQDIPLALEHLRPVLSIQGRIETRSEQLQKLLNDIWTAEFAERAQALENRSQLGSRLIFAALLATLLVSFCLAVFIGRKLARVITAIEQLSDGSLESLPEHLQNDAEYGAIFRISAEMVRTREKLYHSNELLIQGRTELESRIQESTKHLMASNHELRSEIQDRVSAETRLRLYKSIFEATDEAILICDADNRILDINNAFARDTGFSRHEVLGQDPGISKSGRHDKAFYEDMWQRLETKGVWRGEIWDRRRSGEIYPKLLTINVMRNDAGERTHFIGIFRDISKQKANEKKLALMAFNDPLTGLPNRALFRDRLDHEIERAHREKKQFSLFFIDLDHFKPINDRFGHETGDTLLIQVAQRTRECLRQSDTLARLGGDEFVAILPDAGDSAKQRRLANKIIQRISEPYFISGNKAEIGASIGIALYPDNGTDYDTLTHNADMAMYQAKSAGRGTCHFYLHAKDDPPEITPSSNDPG